MISRISLMLITCITICILSISCAQAAAFRSAFRQISPEEADAIVAALSNTTDPYANRTYPVIAREDKTPAQPIANAQLLSSTRTPPSEKRSPLCLCPDFIPNIPHDEEAALEYVLNDHPSHSTADQRTIFERLTNSDIAPIDWVYAFEKNPPKKKKRPHTPADIAYALVDILSSPHITDISVWPAIKSLIALCLHKLKDTTRHAALANGNGDRETTFTIGAARNALRLVAYAFEISKKVSMPLLMTHNKYRLSPPACAISKTMLQLFHHYGADFSWRRPYSYETLLHLSMLPDPCPCTTHYLLKLCEQGIIDINTTTIYRETALHTLVQQAKHYNGSKKQQLLQKAELLCSSAINMSARNYEGKTAVQILEEHHQYWVGKTRNGHFLTREEETSIALSEEMLNALRVAAGRQRSAESPRRLETLSYSPRILLRPPTSPTGSPASKSNSPSASHGGLRAS